MKTLTVEDGTWQKLTILKAELLGGSIDEVINVLISGYENSKKAD